MTKDIEGKVRIELDKIIWKAMCGTATQGLMPNDKEALVNEALSSILSLTTKADTDDDSCIENCVEIAVLQEEIVDLKEDIENLKNKVELDEKEVEKVLEREETEDLEPPYRCLPPIDKKMIEIKSKLICSHFSKPVIKYPEKKEGIDWEMGDMQLNHKNQGYNQAIDDMRKLNGEGGV